MGLVRVLCILFGIKYRVSKSLEISKHEGVHHLMMVKDRSCTNRSQLETLKARIVGFCTCQ